MPKSSLKPNASDDLAGLLRAELLDAGIVADDARWVPFSGGRTNRIWRIGDQLVCKYYDAGGGSPLFPNDVSAEALVLRVLSGTGLAPELVAEFQSSVGTCLLYEFVDGKQWGGQIAPVAHALARLHAITPPKSLRTVSGGSNSVVAAATAILDECKSDLATRLRSLRPPSKDFAPSVPVFLHGDLVPGNIVCSARGPILIDWQCPAIGDACDDIAVFLSPAMQTLYGHRILQPDEIAVFFRTYGSQDALERYDAMRPLYHWRMAAHCLWKSERGHPDYLNAMQLELDCLEQG